MTEQIQILVDGNAVGYTAHHGDVITTADGMQVQAVFGVLATIRDLKDYVPNANIIVLWDGRSWRKDVLASYKDKREANLEDFDPSKPMDEKERKRYDAATKKASIRSAYKKQGPFIEEALRHLAIPQATCFNYEADDLAALFADRYLQRGFPVRLVTSDGDWYQLIQNRVVWKSPRAPFTFVSSKNFAEVTGFRDAEQFVEAKTLRGDIGDCVPSIPGFGDKTVDRFFEAFDSLGEFFSWSDTRIEQTWQAHFGKKAPKCIIELYQAGPAGELLQRNRTLVDLRTPNRPAPSEIKIERGEINPGALMTLCKRLDLYKLSSDLGRFMKAFTGE